MTYKETIDTQGFQNDPSYNLLSIWIAYNNLLLDFDVGVKIHVTEYVKRGQLRVQFATYSTKLYNKPGS